MGMHTFIDYENWGKKKKNNLKTQKVRVTIVRDVTAGSLIQVVLFQPAGRPTSHTFSTFLKTCRVPARCGFHETPVSLSGTKSEKSCLAADGLY